MEGLVCVLWLIGVAITIYWMVLGYRAVEQLTKIASEVQLIRHLHEAMQRRASGS